MKVFRNLQDAIEYIEQLFNINTLQAIEELTSKSITKQNNIIYIVDEFDLLG